MNQKPLFLTILLLLSLIFSGCGTSTVPALASVEPTASPAAIATAVPTSLPAATSTTPPTSTSAPEPTTTIAPTPASGEVQVSAKDGMEMVYVPAGDFSMGSTAGTSDEQPVHTVTLDGFWIDKTEITNLMYSQCVQADACLRPNTNGSNTHVNYYSNTQYANYPVIDLRWSSAEKYCAWAGRRLPTEAEWEKAARGTDGRIYPWGNDNPTNSLLNFNNPAGDALRVGSFPKGVSPYGALDMVGNLREWVADWYGANYYAASPQSNPIGPMEGQYRVLRGGSWHSDLYLVRSADRQFLAPDTRDISVGFRCVLASP